MALVNALLVRWRDGFHAVEDTGSVAVHGRHEGYLELGAAQSVDEVERVAASVFALEAIPTVATTVGLEPVGAGDAPYVDFDVADYVTAPDERGVDGSFRVRALSVSEDDNGNPLFVPELRSLLEENDELLQRWLRRMASGALGGRTESASPAPAAGGGQAESPSSASNPEFVFAQSGPVTVSTSGRFKPRRSGRVVAVDAELEVAGTTATIVALRKNGVTVATLTIPAGANEATSNVSIPFTGPRADYLNVAVTSAGTGAQAVTVQIGTQT